MPPSRPGSLLDAALTVSPFRVLGGTTNRIATRPMSVEIAYHTSPTRTPSSSAVRGTRDGTAQGRGGASAGRRRLPPRAGVVTRWSPCTRPNRRSTGAGPESPTAGALAQLPTSGRAVASRARPPVDRPDSTAGARRPHPGGRSSRWCTGWRVDRAARHDGSWRCDPMVDWYLSRASAIGFARRAADRVPQRQKRCGKTSSFGYTFSSCTSARGGPPSRPPGEPVLDSPSRRSSLEKAFRAHARTTLTSGSSRRSRLCHSGATTGPRSPSSIATRSPRRPRARGRLVVVSSARARVAPSPCLDTRIEPSNRARRRRGRRDYALAAGRAALDQRTASRRRSRAVDSLESLTRIPWRTSSISTGWSRSVRLSAERC